MQWLGLLPCRKKVAAHARSFDFQFQMVEVWHLDGAHHFELILYGSR